jgi:U3 small nucleolar RNA-associated protein 6
VEEDDMMLLPKLTAIDINPDLEGDKVDNTALQNLESTPAMSGAIPIAIFDAMTAHFNKPSIGFDFFNLVLEYDQLPASRKIVEHIERKLLDDYPRDWQAQACHIQAPLTLISPSSPEFPAAFKLSLARLKSARKDTNSAEFTSWAQSLLEKLLKEPDLDQGIRTVAESVLASWLKS